MSQQGTEVIGFEVILKAKVEAPEDVPEPSAVGKGKTNLSENEEAAARLKELVKGMDDNGVKNLRAFALNPTSTMESKMLQILGRAGVYGAVAAAIISLVIESPEIVTTIIEQLGQKGGPLNMDYVRRFNEDLQVGIDKDLQYRRAIGFDIVITNFDTDFILTDPAFTNNSLVDIEVTRTDRISSNTSKYGYSAGV